MNKYNCIEPLHPVNTRRDKKPNSISELDNINKTNPNSNKQ